jgi:hypothetical protein
MNLRTLPRVALTAALALTLLPATGRTWGGQVHHYIAQHYSAHLPPWVDGLRAYDAVVDDESTVPDERKGSTPGEAEKHYIDIDWYPEWLAGTFPHDRATLEARYGDYAVRSHGLLPWAIEDTYATLTQQIRTGSWSAAALTIGDLSHYVADATQPLHCTENYDGDMTGQGGIHSRYESVMMAGHIDDLVAPTAPAESLASAREAAFACIGDSYAAVAGLLRADEDALRSASGYDATYYALLWNSTATMTRARIDSAIVLTASLVYSAWIDAGRPAVPGSSATWGPPVVALSLAVRHHFVEGSPVEIDWSGAGPVSLDVLDVTGRRVARLVTGGSGEGTVQWPSAANGARAGVYFVRLHAPAGQVVRRLYQLN